MQYKRKEKFYLQIQYVAIDKTIHVTYSHIIYLMSHVNYLKNSHGWFHESPRNGSKKITLNQYWWKKKKTI